MTYTEALTHFNNSRRKLAYFLDVSIQAVHSWSKKPEKNIPLARAEQIQKMLVEKAQENPTV